MNSSFLLNDFLIPEPRCTSGVVTQQFCWISGVDRGRQRLRGTTTSTPWIRRYRSGERCRRRGGSTWRSSLSPVGGPPRWPARLRKGAQEIAGTRGEAALPAGGQGRGYVPRVRSCVTRPEAQEICLRRRSKVRRVLSSSKELPAPAISSVTNRCLPGVVSQAPSRLLKRYVTSFPNQSGLIWAFDDCAGYDINLDVRIKESNKYRNLILLRVNK